MGHVGAEMERFRAADEPPASCRALPRVRVPRAALAALVALTVLGSGCCRFSNFRKRILHRDDTLPCVELGAPATPIAQAPAAPPVLVPDTEARRRRAVSDLAWRTIGWSSDGRPIEAYEVGRGVNRVLVIGGIHGDEPEGLPLVERLADELAQDRTAVAGSTVVLVRNLNPDGTAARQRTNGRGVDLNRNFPATNWTGRARRPDQNPGPAPTSEPETELLVGLLSDFRPDRIVVLHSTRGEPMVNYDGPALGLAEAMSEANGYPARDTIGYPTPGSLGSYAGIDQQIPIITLELPRGIAADAAWQKNRDSLYRAIRY
jgi:protein MpaA